MNKHPRWNWLTDRGLVPRLLIPQIPGILLALELSTDFIEFFAICFATNFFWCKFLDTKTGDFLFGTNALVTEKIAENTNLESLDEELKKCSF